MYYKSIKLSTLSITLATLLSACGGSSSGFQSKSFDGVAVDFYISGATVKFDDCNTSVTTDSAGKFNFTTTESCQESSITVTGGTDIVTRLPFTSQLKSKKIKLQDLSISSTAPEVVLSPLTTLEYYAEAKGVSLDSLLDKLGLSSLKGKNFSSFDPQASATAAEMAKIFVIQQIVNKIDKPGASEAGFSQLVSALNSSSNGLFVNGALNQTLVSALTDSSIAAKFDTLYGILTNAIADGGSNVNLANLIETKNLLPAIRDAILDAAYTDILIAGKSIAELKASSTTTPIQLNLASLNTLLNVNFKAASTTTTADSIQIAFKLKGIQNAQTEELNVLVEKVDLKFSNGALTSATIPAGTKISVSSTLYSVEDLSFTLQNDTNLGTTINLNTLTNSNDTLKTFYDKFYVLLNVGAQVEAEAYIKSENFSHASEGLEAEKTVTVGTSSFVGQNLKAYFKLN